jgi:hypothetical protein
LIQALYRAWNEGLIKERTEMTKNIRQGDFRVERTNDKVTGKTQKQLTVAEGEQTGHNHVLVAGVNSTIVGDKTKFEVKGTAKLVHPEHDTIEFNSGVYVVIPEREFDYIEETINAVKD